MNIYISSAACISPQQSFGLAQVPVQPVAHNSNFLKAIEPAYQDILDPKLTRRMSRIIRMGVATAIECLKEGDVTNPGAIVTGTAYGCLEDTGIFLSRLIEQDEQMLSPTAFIQSTHNTVGAQIALMHKCNEYNNTFVHRGFSFESALLDSIMLLREGEAKNVLVGGIDEITDTSFAILNRFGLYKKENISNLSLFQSTSKGTIAGEGAAFFLLSSVSSENNLAQLEGLSTFYKPSSNADIVKNIGDFVNEHALTVNDIDLVITGRNGDEQNDEVYNYLRENIFINNEVINYKHLCGEYPTAVSFAMWFAAKILHTNGSQQVMGYNAGKQIKRILIYNNYLGIHHSLILLTAVNQAAC